MTLTDQSTGIREGEELDAAQIDPYLKAHIPGLTGTPRISQFPGGASNLTYLLEYPEQEFVLRRPPFGHKAKSAHDMGREYRILNQLNRGEGRHQLARVSSTANAANCASAIARARKTISAPLVS